MFKALAQRIARYVLRDELSFYETECTKLQDELDKMTDYDYLVYVHTNKLNDELRKELHAADRDNAFLYEQLKELHAENDGLRIDLNNGSNFTNELMAELRELRGAKDNAVRLLNLCEPPF